MTLIVTALGSVNWVNTRQVLVSSAAFSAGMHNFGLGGGTGTAENSAICPVCKRKLPTALMHLDHILPKSKHSLKLQSDDTEVFLLDEAPPHGSSSTYHGICKGGTLTIEKLGTGGPTRRQSALATARAVPYRPPSLGTAKVVSTEAAWLNDLENLQWLCGACNTTKGDREFSFAFPSAAAAPFK